MDAAPPGSGGDRGGRPAGSRPRGLRRRGEGLGEKATVGANVRTSGAQTVPRSESDIRINFWNPTQIIAASNNIGGSGQQAQYYSTNGGATWGQSFLPLVTGDSFHSDPTVDWTSDGTAWSTTIGINGAGTTLKMRAYKSTNGGATWTFDDTFSGTQTNTDKQMMWVDHSATSAFKNYIYVCWHNGNPAFVNRRTGPAGAWGTPIQVSGAETTGTAIGCDVKTNSAGDAFVFWPATGNRRILVAKSTNGGTSWGAPVIVATAKDGYDIGVPSFNNRRALIYVSGGAYRTATKNLVYATWTDLTGATGCTSAANEPGSNAASTCKTRIWFSRSTNGGTTWSRAGDDQQPGLAQRSVQPVAGRRRDHRPPGGDLLRHGRRRRPARRPTSGTRPRATTAPPGPPPPRSPPPRPTRRSPAPTPATSTATTTACRSTPAILPLLDRPPQRRQGRDLDRAGDRAVKPSPLSLPELRSAPPGALFDFPGSP